MQDKAYLRICRSISTAAVCMPCLYFKAEAVAASTKVFKYGLKFQRCTRQPVTLLATTFWLASQNQPQSLMAYRLGSNRPSFRV